MTRDCARHNDAVSERNCLTSASLISKVRSAAPAIGLRRLSVIAMMRALLSFAAVAICAVSGA
jgi:hypothetical protein